MSESVRKQGLDKFYTNNDYALKCIENTKKLFDFNNFDTIIEPSAGSGNFMKNINHTNLISIDIEPENENIIKQDFLTYSHPTGKKVLIIGNPPFGKVNSLSVKFFNHAASFAEVIAFIVPRTWRKESIQNRLNINFHLVFDEDTPTNPCCFTPKLNVKCCFQIWEKRAEPRILIKLPTHHKDWAFLPYGPLDEKKQPTPPIGADFVIKAYGSNIGQIISENLETLRPKSWHWIKSNIDINILKDNFRKLDFGKSKNTARQESMGKAELVFLYSEIN